MSKREFSLQGSIGEEVLTQEIVQKELRSLNVVTQEVQPGQVDQQDAGPQEPFLENAIIQRTVPYLAVIYLAGRKSYTSGTATVWCGRCPDILGL